MSTLTLVAPVTSCAIAAPGGDAARPTLFATKVNVNVLPTPGALFTVRSPPISRACPRLMARPRPVPPARFPASSCSKGWKIRAVSLRRDTNPRVRDDDLDRHRAAGTVRTVRARARGRLEADRAPLGELEGIAREVDQDLLHLGAVAQDRTPQIGSALDRERDTLGRGVAGEHPLDLVERRPEIERTFDELGTARLNLGHIEQVVHERQQMLPARAHDADLLLLRSAERGVALEELGVPQNEVQRVPHLVGHVRQKLALGPVGALRFILGIAELARTRLDELLQPFAVAAELGHVVHLSDDADGPTAAIGDD